MATKSEIDFSYTTMDKIWRLSVGEMADFTGARYDGDFTMNLEDAKKAIEY
jgi:cyclopropane-fatty-acyl-phospholipid synthase